MIQIHIPTYQTLIDRNDPYTKFTVFDIHVNGAFHASVRYSNLCTLHEKLIENFGFRLSGPEFPPKKIWKTLDAKALNERREGLAKYFQGLITIPDVSRHHLIERAFLEYQVSSFAPTLQTISIQIYLPDGHPIKVDCYSDDSSNVVLKKFCRNMKVEEKNTDFFGLFLAKDREEKSNGMISSVLFDYVCVRWLKNFESPFISLALANKEIDDEKKQYKILVRRIVWDSSVEEQLHEDPGALKLLYLQALNDIHHNFIDISAKTKEELARLSEQNDFKKFMQICHKHPSYGFEVLESVISDYPAENTKSCFKVGRRMIVLQYVHDGRLTQALLRSTRIRTWKISHTDAIAKKSQMTFQIEYVLGSGVDIMTFQTNQAVLISLFLQSIADEILRDCRSESPTTYKFDDSIQTKVLSNLNKSKENSVITDDLNDKDESDKEKLNPLFQIISYQMPFENETFEFISDNDL
uniref:PX domain-containing protein n=1 Tax=Panagrolaimus superbus TaxID=310955 RepID=A0A914XT91_9BILA